ncbi:MAG: hypothetical protein V3T19_01765, partial [Acidiferrobacterales bacterium]
GSKVQGRPGRSPETRAGTVDSRDGPPEWRNEDRKILEPRSFTSYRNLDPGYLISDKKIA